MCDCHVFINKHIYLFIFITVQLWLTAGSGLDQQKRALPYKPFRNLAELCLCLAISIMLINVHN